MTNSNGQASVSATANNTVGGPYHVTASVSGVSSKASFSLTNNPTTVKVTVGTTPGGLSFTVDGKTYTSTQMFNWTIGGKHTLATTTPQRVTGIDYQSPVWSDGGSLSHTVTAAVNTTTYTATFKVYYQLTTASSPTAGGQVTPYLGSFYPAGSLVSIQATPTSGYSFKNWTGNVANPSSKNTTVTMAGPETVTANFSKK
jgi:hypothetical protein